MFSLFYTQKLVLNLKISGLILFFSVKFSFEMREMQENELRSLKYVKLEFW